MNTHPKQARDDLKPERETIAVWFSCGAASAVAAKLTIEQFGNTHNIRIINNPVAEEDEDNRRFLKDVETWLGYPIELATNEDWPDAKCTDVWAKRRWMYGGKGKKAGAPCTVELKKMARYQWEVKNKAEWLVLGFTVEEQRRHNDFVKRERPTLIPVLIDAGMTKQACFDMLSAAGIKLPRIYLMGYPNANCIGCVKASSPTYWNHVRKMHPDVFSERAKQSREIGCKLTRVKGVRVFIDELDPEARGRPLKSMKMDCNSFCEEKS